MLKTFPNTGKYLKSKLSFCQLFRCLKVHLKVNIHLMFLICLYVALVSFGKVTAEQKELTESFGLAIYSWDEFLQLVSYLLSVITSLQELFNSRFYLLFSFKNSCFQFVGRNFCHAREKYQVYLFCYVFAHCKILGMTL